MPARPQADELACFASVYVLIVRQVLGSVFERDEAAPSRIRAASRHRPPAPPAVEDCRVADDVVEVLYGRVGAGGVWVAGPGIADPGQVDTRLAASWPKSVSSLP